MSIEDICALPVGNLADKDCALFLWVTIPCLPVSYTHLVTPQGKLYFAQLREMSLLVS